MNSGSQHSEQEYEQEYSLVQPAATLGFGFSPHYPWYILQAKNLNKLNLLLPSPYPFHFKFAVIFDADTNVNKLRKFCLQLVLNSKTSPDLANLSHCPKDFTSPRSEPEPSEHLLEQMTLYY